MEIDIKAPFAYKKSIEIDAPLQKVWDLQTDINNWRKWQKTVSFARLQGKLEKGTVFTWKAMGVNIRSLLWDVIPHQAIGWTGKSFGMHVVHIFRFEKRGDKTHVTMEESFAGWLPRFMRIFMPTFFERSMVKALQNLKETAEK